MTKYRNTLARMGGVLLLAGAFVMTNAAQADASLKVWVCSVADCSAGPTTIVTDGGAGDLNPTAGRVAVLDAGFDIQTALSYPAAGSLAKPYLNIKYTITNGSIAGPFIYASFDGYTPPGAALRFVANASDGGGTAAAYGGATPFAPPAIFGAGALFSGLMPVDTGFAGPLNNPYFLAIGLNVTPGVESASGDATLFVPEPAMMALFGLGLFGAGIASRRRKQRQAE